MEVVRCSIDKWYPRFAHLTFKSIILPLDDHMVEFLEHSDGIVIPDLSDQDCDNVPVAEFMRKIESVISENFKEGVFPKLNWSSPRDANWMSATGTMQCHDSEQVLLLLKSSDHIAHDLGHSFDESEETAESAGWRKHYVLALRDWAGDKIHGAFEFRVFVRERTIVGISQRNFETFFPFLEAVKEELRVKITEFLDPVVKEFESTQFVADVCFLTDRMGLNVKSVKLDGYRFYPCLVDINPYSRVTDPCLFSWTGAPLNGTGHHAAADPEFRVATQRGVRPAFSAENRLPLEVVELLYRQAEGAPPAEAVAEMIREVRSEIRKE